MKNLVPFNLFESVKPLHPDADEFIKALDSGKWGKKLSGMIEIKPVKTGRIYITSRFLPSVTYFWKDGTAWHYVFSSAGKEYGNQRSNDIDSLFELMIIDCIKKSAPTGFTRSDIEKMVSDKKWLFDNADSESIINGDIYKKYREISNPQVITDFSKIRTTVMDRLLFNGIAGSSINKGGSIVLNFTNHIYSEHNSTWPFHIIASLLSEGGRIIFKNGIDSVTISPGKPGKEISTSKYRDFIKIRMSLGYQNSPVVERYIDETLEKYIKKVEVYIRGDQGEKKSGILTDLYHEVLLNDGNRSWEEVLDEYIKSNPLDIVKLDSVPRVKEGVLKRTGLRDYSKIASALSTGII